MMQVNIHRTFGQIAIDRKSASIRLKGGPADFRLELKHPSVKHDREQPEIEIDFTGSWASMGYKNPVPLQKEISGDGNSAALAGIKRTADQGDLMGGIEKGVNPFPALAAAAWPEKSFNIGLIPGVPPEISFKGGTGKFDAAAGDVTVKSRPTYPKILTDKAKIDIYLKVKPSIDIQVAGQWFDVSG